MAAPNPPLARHARLLVSLLVRPDEGLRWTAAEWELAVRAGRRARILGTLRARLDRAGLLARIPAPAAQMLESDYRVSLQRATMARAELRSVAAALRQIAVMPLPMAAGVFGMARTMGVPAPKTDS